MFRYAEVLVDVANRRLDQSFYYLIPEYHDLKIGMRVLVFLQNRKVQGLVVNVTNDLPDELTGLNLKPILEIMDEDSLVPPALIELAHWLAQTTICSVAQSLHTVWPLLKGKVQEWVKLMAAIKDLDVQTLQWLDQDAFRAITVLNRARNKAIPLKIFLKRADISEATLEKLLLQGWAKKETRFVSKREGTLQKAFLAEGSLEEAALRRKDDDLNDDRDLTSERTYKLTGEQTTAVRSVLAALTEGSPQTILSLIHI